MSRFFPDVDAARAARDRYLESDLSEALAQVRECHCEVPHGPDVTEMVSEFASLLEALGVPDRDGTDFAVIVPIVWQGVSRRATVTLDFGRRLMRVVNHPTLGTGPIPDEVFVGDTHLPQNLQLELSAVLVTYKNTD